MDHTMVAADPPPQSSNPVLPNNSNGMSLPLQDASFFTQGLNGDEDAFNFNLDDNEVVLDDFDIDFDFSFDDLHPASLSPPSQPQQTGFASDCFVLPGSDPNLAQFPPDRSLRNAFKATVQDFSEDMLADVDNLNSSSSPEPDIFKASAEQGMNEIYGDRGHDVSGYLNMQSPESSDSRVLSYPSPESQGSGNCRSDVSEGSSNKSISSSPNFGNICPNNVSIAEEIKLEHSNKSSAPLLKRKKEGEDSDNSDSRTNKFQKSAYSLSDNANYSSDNTVVLTEEDEKRVNRLMRNRESAQLSRQRKKHYVEELQDKVKSMGSAIQDLNAQIAYVMAENATLRQQMSGGRVQPPHVPPPPPPGMYPPHMMYPWMPYGVSPYMMKSQGSQVPLVPIPRLKSQQPAPTPKVSKKPESKRGVAKPESKKAEAKTKKVASVSFLGLLFFLFLFGGLVPMVNLRYGGVSEAVSGVANTDGNLFYQKHHERVLSVSRNLNGAADNGKIQGVGESAHNVSRGQDDDGGELNMNHGIDEHGSLSNGSVPLAASLYVPRNDKLVKIDGNLIIHSVLASERAMASRYDPSKEANTDTRLAVPADMSPVRQVSGGKPSNVDRTPSKQPRALGSASVEENVQKRAAVSSLQQWFQEGLAGPMLSSEMCTEVFQFDVSSAIVPVIPTRKESVVEQGQNSTDLNKGNNRRTSAKARILHDLPTSSPGSPHNITNEGTGRNSQETFSRNNSLSSMIVSVLVDPREVDDIDGNGVMGPKSLSRIFVVVLMDSVKYVTYSCMLPFKGAVVSHLVTN